MDKVRIIALSGMLIANIIAAGLQAAVPDAKPSLVGNEDLRKILFVAVHPHNNFEKHRAKWGQVFSAYHIQWLDRSTAFNDTGFEDRLDIATIETAHKHGIFTASYFTQNPVEITPEWGFKVKYYKHLPSANRWCNPTGVPFDDPYEAAGSRDLHGGQVYAEGTARMAMSIFSPYWLDYQKASIAYVLSHGVDAIDIDSAGQVGGFYGMRGDFSDWAVKAFRDHLRNQVACGRLHLPDTLQIDTFDIKAEFQKLLTTAKNPDQLLNKPLIKEWVIFNYSTLQDFHRSLNAYAKEYGLKTGKSYVPYYGNLCLGDQLYPLAIANPSVILGPCMDVIQVENAPAVPPLRLTTLHKLGMAMGDYQKPVWSLHSPYSSDSYESKFALHPDHPYEALLQIYIAECYAAGVIPEIDLGGWSVERQTLFIKPDCTPLIGLIPYFDFVFNHQDLFLDVEPYNKVALVYSVPTFTWNDLPQFQKYLGLYRTTFLGLGRAMEELHIPYDVLIFGQAGLWDDADSLNRLSKYHTIVLPLIDCISDEQTKALEKFVASGGKLLITEDRQTTACRKEDYSLRDRGALDDLLKQKSKVRTVAADAVNRYCENSINSAREDAFGREIIRRAVGQAEQLQTDASPRIGINVFRQKHRTIIHLVNHDYVKDTDAVPSRGPFFVKIVPAEGSNQAKVRYFSPELNEPMLLESQSSGSTVSIQVPYLKVWAIIVIE